jgi:hypothetical protein
MYFFLFISHILHCRHVIFHLQSFVCLLSAEVFQLTEYRYTVAEIKLLHAVHNVILDLFDCMFHDYSLFDLLSL